MERFQRYSLPKFSPFWAAAILKSGKKSCFSCKNSLGLFLVNTGTIRDSKPLESVCLQFCLGSPYIWAILTRLFNNTEMMRLPCGNHWSTNSNTNKFWTESRDKASSSGSMDNCTWYLVSFLPDIVETILGFCFLFLTCTYPNTILHPCINEVEDNSMHQASI